MLMSMLHVCNSWLFGRGTMWDCIILTWTCLFTDENSFVFYFLKINLDLFRLKELQTYFNNIEDHDFLPNNATKEIWLTTAPTNRNSRIEIYCYDKVFRSTVNKVWFWYMYLWYIFAVNMWNKIIHPWHFAWSIFSVNLFCLL